MELENLPLHIFLLQIILKHTFRLLKLTVALFNSIYLFFFSNSIAPVRQCTGNLGNNASLVGMLI